MSLPLPSLTSLRRAFFGRMVACLALAAMVSTLAAPFAASAREAQASSASACTAAGLDGGACRLLLSASDAESVLDALGFDTDQRADVLALLDRSQGFSAPPLPLATLESSRSLLSGVTSHVPVSPALVGHAADAVAAAAPALAQLPDATEVVPVRVRLRRSLRAHPEQTAQRSGPADLVTAARLAGCASAPFLFAARRAPSGGFGLRAHRLDFTPFNPEPCPEFPDA